MSLVSTVKNLFYNTYEQEELKANMVQNLMTVTDKRQTKQLVFYWPNDGG
jgi:hypothetical protein